MELPGKHVIYLSKRIGPRGPGSDGESAAAAYVSRIFNESGITTETEGFYSWKSDLHALIILFGLTIVSYFIFLNSYAFSFLISLVVFFLFQMETYTWGTVSKLLRKTSSSNVIGKIIPDGHIKKRIIFVANYDTAKNSPLGNSFISRFYNIFYIVAFMCIIAVTALGIAGLGASLLRFSKESIRMMWLVMSPFPAYLLLFTLLILIGEIWGRYQSGANDNSSGVAVLLYLMGRLSKEPPESVEVWGVATGRGFAGGRGMVDLIKRHRAELKNAYIINLDHVGKGETKLLTREGAIIGFRCNNQLKRLAFDTTRKLIHTHLGKGKCRVKKSDGMVAMARGFKAITIAGNSKGGTYFGYRSSDDTTDKISRSSLDRAARISLAIVTAVDSQQPTGHKLDLSRPAKETDNNIQDKEEELIPR